MEYLEKYIAYRKIEMPALKLTVASADVALPEHYLSYIDEWEQLSRDLADVVALEVEAAEDANSSGLAGNGDMTEANTVLERWVKQLGTKGEKAQKDDDPDKAVIK
ncbi:hypothetical protein EGN72_12380 [Pseudorhodobacter sp. E13]|uniref:hypothetical protein n=1 Tax=Pseudorhodobacter sp. E13 TaxID=2487931 RepID=UPI000FB13721|nr:hypothetical protein [Pseudorhodobacter sp. E13]RUS59511.1 hypothetical protein EGN72_12380 [Pseudorhodobacter sp. E13]